MSNQPAQRPSPWTPGHGVRPTAGQLRWLRATYDAGEGFDDPTRGLVTGARLFDAGYYWEAHEVWEAEWHEARRVGDARAEPLRGLILLAAVAVKARQGRTARLGAMLRRCESCLATHTCGLDTALDNVVTAALARVAAQPALVEPIDFSPFQRPSAKLWCTE